MALRSVLAAVVLLVGSTPAQAQSLTVSVAVSVATPLSGEVVTFTSGASGPLAFQSWDLDGDGAFDDAVGAVATHSFPRAGTYTVRLRAIASDGSEAVASQRMVVGNRPPTSSFSYSPTSPLPGNPMVFNSTATDPEGTLIGYQWDLDGDGEFDDATGSTASRSFSSPGRYTIRLRVSDREGAIAETNQVVSIATPPLSPFPLVRIVGTAGRSGTRVRRLMVQAPAGSRVELRCRRRSCPFRRRTAVVPRSASLELRGLRRLRPRAVLEIRVTKPGTIGKYTRLLVRRRGLPRRRDLCVRPNARRPVACPPFV